MADKVGDEFEGYITGVAAFGLFIELIEHFVEGWCTSRPWPTTTTGSSSARTCCAARTPTRCIGSATR